MVLPLLKNILFPSLCVLCRREGPAACDKCLGRIQHQAQQVCPYCYKQSAGGAACEKCCAGKMLNGLVVCCSYDEGTIGRLIHAFKYDFVMELAEPLGRILQRTEIAGDLLTFVPLHAGRRRWRGFNQAELLAAQMRNFETLRLLQRVSYRGPQMELDREDRFENMKGAFEMAAGAPSILNKEIVIVDDVATTLATLEECAKVLKKKGAARVTGFTLARSYT